jgi:hypothetical protein
MLETVSITVEAIENDIGSVLLIANDTAHHVRTVAGILPELSTRVTDLQNELPSIANNVELLIKLTVILSP